MIAELTRLRFTIWRRTPNAMRGLGITIGALIALGTLGVAGGEWSSPNATGVLLALAFAAWLAGWVMGPIQTGGNDFLRPEWFALLPIRARHLTTAMLAAGVVSAGPAITLIASAGLVLYGAQHGIAAAVIGVPAMVAQVLLMMTTSKLAAETLGASAKSRIMLEVTAAQYGLFVAAMFVGWFVLPQFLEVAGAIGAEPGDVLPPAARTLIMLLPSGWGVVAVESAGDGNWPLTAAALGGLSLLTLLGQGAYLRPYKRERPEARSGGT